MKNRGYYVLIAILVVICGYLGYKNINQTEYIHKVYAVSETPLVWYQAIVEDVNVKGIQVNIDGTKSSISDKAVMGNLLEIMFPISSISEAFNCGVHVYDEDKIVLEKSNGSVSLTVGSGIILDNGTEIQLDVSPQYIDEKLYIPISAIVKGLKYEYTWNAKENVATLINTSTEKAIPYSYDYRNTLRNSVVKDQGSLGTCWSFAALSAIETTLLPEESYDFSVDHMTLNNSFNISQKTGGDYAMAVAYLAAWQGPVLTSEDEYNDGETDASLTVQKHVQEVQFLESKNFDKIKEMVFKYGAVQTSLYMNNTSTSVRSRFYNKATYAYYYVGTQKSNHDIIIIGWDDNYPKENFSIQPDSNGAFICQNSWGSDFGDEGIFFVSYYDTNIGMHNVVYTKVEDTDNYDNIYQTDLCGIIGYMGYDRDTAYFANVYTAQSDETLEAVSFYSTGIDTTYQVYVCNGFENVNDLTSKRISAASGKLGSAGYYTIDIDQEIRLEEGTKYAVIVKITTPNSEKPVAVEFQNDSKTSSVDLSDGEGYISWNGIKWEDTELSHKCNICLKAFTNKVE